jgi:hypothetical protein
VLPVSCRRPISLAPSLNTENRKYLYLDLLSKKTNNFINLIMLTILASSLKVLHKRFKFSKFCCYFFSLVEQTLIIGKMQLPGG